MTLFVRNSFFKAAIAIAAAFSLAALAASFYVIPAYSLLAAQDLQRGEGLFHGFASGFLPNDFFAVHAALSAAVLISLVSVILIYKFFEKTQSPEIFFMALFSLSLSFEAARLVLPLHFVFGISPFYHFMAFRLLLLGRFFGLFSIFMAGLCAAGFNAQKPANIALALFFLSLIIAWSLPIDLQAWYSSLNIAAGFSQMFSAVEAAALLLAALSFFASANIRGSKEFVFVGAGAALAACGRGLLLYADNWAGAVSGACFLAVGAWLICARLHKFYLWM